MHFPSLTTRKKKLCIPQKRYNGNILWFWNRDFSKPWYTLKKVIVPCLQVTEGHKTCLTTESVCTLGTQMDYWIVKRVSFWVCECSRLVTIWSWACLASGRSDEWAALCVFIIRPSLESFLPPINLMAPTQDGLASSRQSGTCRRWSALPLAHRVDNFKEVSAGTCFVGLCVWASQRFQPEFLRWRV